MTDALILHAFTRPLESFSPSWEIRVKVPKRRAEKSLLKAIVSSLSTLIEERIFYQVFKAKTKGKSDERDQVLEVYEEHDSKDWQL